MIRAPAPHRVVLTYGCFDQFDQQQSQFLRRLSALGDELIIGCTTDELANLADHTCVQHFDSRRAMLESCRFVSRVIAEETSQQKRTDIVNYNVSVFVMGENQIGQFDDLCDIAQVHYLPGYNDPVRLTQNCHAAFA